MLKVFMVSGGTGKAAERVARGAFLQFKDAPVELVLREHTRSKKQVRALVQEAEGEDSLILHTLVNEDLRREMLNEARLHSVKTVDIMGPILDHLAEHLKLTPLGQPGLLAQTEEAKTRQIEAVEFAFRHDDGQNVADLDSAEVVLVGVSRSMKTPTMLYMAYRGWFVANVPLIPDIDPPEELLSLPGSQVYYLHVAADRLRELRVARAERQSIPVEPYASMANVRNELRQAQRWAGKQGWRKIDVTGKSVEEASREIILLASGGTARSRPSS